MKKYKTIYDMAVKEICPNSLKPSTVYEINMVKKLAMFGVSVADALTAPSGAIEAFMIDSEKWYDLVRDIARETIGIGAQQAARKLYDEQADKHCELRDKLTKHSKCRRRRNEHKTICFSGVSGS